MGLLLPAAVAGACLGVVQCSARVVREQGTAQADRVGRQNGSVVEPQTHVKVQRELLVGERVGRIGWVGSEWQIGTSARRGLDMR